VAESVHRPVLLAEALERLAIKPGGVYLDATLGGGSFSEGILLAGAGRVVGLDWDPEALERAKKRLAPYGERMIPLSVGFQEVEGVLAGLTIPRVDGLVADLGLSSDQLADPGRGFSFQASGPLDMRMDTRAGPTAAEIIARAGEAELRKVIGGLGEEPLGGRISRAIVREREKEPLTTTAQLADLVERVAASGRRSGAGPRKRIHPATRTFQALRLAVNRELENLDRLLESLPRIIGQGGRAVIISYHSLEDRRVKNFFRENSRGCTCPPGRPCVCGGRAVFRLLTPRPVRPGEEEVAANPRARSARLRAVERL